jgi:flagellar biosynthesis GTPase FlhF
MEIANPMYDVVFKYLMEDNAVAITFLSALTGMDILSLEPLPQELILDTGDRAIKLFGRRLTIYRLDFLAKIRDEEGKEKIVILEIQQEKIHGQIVRFRKYLGKQYANEAFVKKAHTRSGRQYDTGIPILAIYFVGEQLEGFRDSPVVLIGQSLVARHTMQVIHGTNPFIEALFHEGIIVNVPSLDPNGRDELETLLSIFSPLNQTTNRQIMSIQETKFMEKYQPILRRLKAAAQERDIRHKMTVEDEFLEEMERYERNYEESMRNVEAQRINVEAQRIKAEAEMRKAEAEMRKAEAEMRKAGEEIRKAEAEMRKAGAEIRKAEAEMRKAEAAKRELEDIQQQKHKAVLLLLELGMSKKEIANKLDLSEEEMQQY